MFVFLCFGGWLLDDWRFGLLAHFWRGFFIKVFFYEIVDGFIVVVVIFFKCTFVILGFFFLCYGFGFWKNFVRLDA
jgi:hypothetical protein